MVTEITPRTHVTEDVKYLDVFTYKSENGGPDVLLGTYLNMVESFDILRTYGHDVSDFHRLKRSGKLVPMTPFTQFSARGEASGTYNQLYDTGSFTNHQHCHTNWVPDSVLTTVGPWYILGHEQIQSYLPEKNDCIVYAQEAAAKIYGSGHDTLTFLAELADVRRLFLKSGGRLLGMKLPSNLKNVSSNWLAARYGWRTLIYDLQDLNKAIQKLSSGRDRLKDRAGFTTTRTDTETKDIVYTSVTRVHTRTDNITIGLRGNVVADVDVPQFQVNPLQTGWELIPFSFVLDWFVSVGKAIAAWSFLALRPDYVACCGYSVKVIRTYTMQSVGWATSWSGTTGFTSTVQAERVRRYPCNIPLIPRIRVNMNPYKVLDLLGLIAQRIH